MRLRLIKELRDLGHCILGCRGYALEPYTLQFKITSWIPVYCLCIGCNIFYIPMHVSESIFLWLCMRLRLFKDLRAHGHYMLGCTGCGLEACTIQLKISSCISFYRLCIGRNIFLNPLNMSDSWLLCPCMSLRLIKELRAHRNYILWCRDIWLVSRNYHWAD